MFGLFFSISKDLSFEVNFICFEVPLYALNFNIAKWIYKDLMFIPLLYVRTH